MTRSEEDQYTYRDPYIWSPGPNEDPKLTAIYEALYEEVRRHEKEKLRHEIELAIARAEDDLCSMLVNEVEVLLDSAASRHWRFEKLAKKREALWEKLYESQRKNPDC